MILDTTQPDHAHVADRLASAWIAWMATTRRNGDPQAVPVWFAWADPVAIVFSGPATAKVGHVQRQGRVVLAVETIDGGNDTVIVEADAELASDDDPAVMTAAEVFSRKYAIALGDGFEQWRAAFSQPILLRPHRIVAWSKPGGDLRYTAITA